MKAAIAQAIIEKIGKEILRKRLMLSRNIQELVGQMLMGAFIASESENYAFLYNYADLIIEIVKAHMAIMIPHSFFSCYKGEIMRYDFLKAWFSQFPAFSAFLEAELSWKRETQLDYILRYVGENYRKHVAKLLSEQEAEQLTNDPKSLLEVLWRLAWSIMRARLDAAFGLVRSLNVALADIWRDESLLGVPCWAFKIINPIIDIDWAIIKSELAIAWAYGLYAGKMLSPKVRPYIPQMLIRLETPQGEILDKTELGGLGEFTLKASPIPEKLEHIIVNMHGHKTELDLLIDLDKLYVYVVDNACIIRTSDTKYTLLDVWLNPEGKLEAEVKFEDEKCDTTCDFRYNDVIVHITDKGKSYELSVWTEAHVHHDKLFWGNIEILDMPPEDGYKFYGRWLMDKNTKEIERIE